MSNTVSFELVDGISSVDDEGFGTGTYIAVDLPPEWLSVQAPFDNALVDALSIDLVDLIEKRMRTAVDPGFVPTPAAAKRTIKALERYASELRRLYATPLRKY